jgi:DNA-directed RNA polymerase subunit E"
MIELVRQPFACGECNRILPDPEKKSEPPQCANCPNAPVTTDWQGFVVIMHPDRSEVAKRLNINSPGNYALKVNIR